MWRLFCLELWRLKLTHASLQEIYEWLLFGETIDVFHDDHGRRLNTVWTEWSFVTVNDGGTFTNNYALNV